MDEDRYRCGGGRGGFELTDGVVVDDALGLGLCCGHGGGIHARAEESK